MPSQPPAPVWYLSFVDDSRPRGSRWMGGCYVRGADPDDAIRAAWVLGCNPGGEVMQIRMNQPVLRAYMDRLLTDPGDIARAIGDEPHDIIHPDGRRVDLERNGR